MGPRSEKTARETPDPIRGLMLFRGGTVRRRWRHV